MKLEDQLLELTSLTGWVLVKDDPDYENYWIEPTTGRKIGDNVNPHPFPDWFNDLNAVRDLEDRLLDHRLAPKYNRILTSICIKAGWWESRATCAQRIEALLKVTERWKDD